MPEPTGLPEPPDAGARALPECTFDGTTVVVTGGGTGLGKAIASEFARLGATIAILSRKDDHLAAGREAIEALGARVVTQTCDIREPEQVAAAFDAVEAEVGLPQVLVLPAQDADRRAEPGELGRDRLAEPGAAAGDHHRGAVVGAGRERARSRVRRLGQSCGIRHGSQLPVKRGSRPSVRAARSSA